MAGNAAGKFKSGQLVPLAAKTPVSNVILTIMQTMGYTDTSFGDSTGDVAALIA